MTAHLPPAAGRRLLRDAGPPAGWVLIALVAGAPIFGLAAASSDGVRLVLILAWLIVLTVPSILDRDGWRLLLPIIGVVLLLVASVLGWL